MAALLSSSRLSSIIRFSLPITASSLRSRAFSAFIA
eukprot:CAMPEP_0174946392 /NCGR_PEP_ID=MMETSP1355-20121228/84044_1 /TAXON_ID=464990 /ORGANISM="Hemiselmis tepida, Strain CCMP443" /LENGTH=35 /DNA_ID= /DNA_START= /DNA_END= /DNA_ORIENTATION=